MPVQMQGTSTLYTFYVELQELHDTDTLLRPVKSNVLGDVSVPSHRVVAGSLSEDRSDVDTLIFTVELAPGDTVYFGVELWKQVADNTKLSSSLDSSLARSLSITTRQDNVEFQLAVTNLTVASAMQTGFMVCLYDFAFQPTSFSYSIDVIDLAAPLPEKVQEIYEVDKRMQELQLNSYDLGDISMDYSASSTNTKRNPHVAPTSPEKPATTIVSPPDSHFPVWYATNRESIRDAAGIITGFSAQRAATTYGKCLVYIPQGHVIGETRSGFWRRVLRTLTFRNDDQALQLTSIAAQESTVYWADIRAAARQWQPDERCAVVFLHGYNVSFEDSAIRAAQIGYDLQIKGPVGFFSWPSQGTLLGYAADEAAIEASEAAITQYLQEFARHSGAEKVHVIAHSMGNRGLLRAVQRIVSNAAADSPKPFHHFILAAPDVDKDLFYNLADHYTRAAQHTTLYISNKDRALASSRMLRIGAARAGLAPPVSVVPDIDTVHVANVDMTLLGHGYVAEAREVLTDMHQLLVQDASPDKRMGLRPAEIEGQRYWVIDA